MIITKLKQFDYNGMSKEKLDYMHTFDFDINIICGGRSNRKSSTIQIMIIDDYFDKNETAVRLVRTKELTKAKFCAQLFQAYPLQYLKEKYGAVVEFKRSKYWFVWYGENGRIIKQEAFMEIAALSKHSDHKSYNFGENCTKIYFDEFVPEDGDYYIDNEYNKLMSFISTVNRNREYGLRVYMVGNMVSVDNPYFEFFDIDPYELYVSNIYDVSIEGFQRVGIYLVESCYESFDRAPRILRSKAYNVQETKQDEFQIPENIIGVEDIFMYLLVYNKDLWKKRFKIKYIIDSCNLEDHDCYIIFYVDRYNDRILYGCTNKKEKSDVYVSMPENILYNKANFTTENSIRELPVFRGKGVQQIKYLDRVARTTIRALIDDGKIF